MVGSYLESPLLPKDLFKVIKIDENGITIARIRTESSGIRLSREPSPQLATIFLPFGSPVLLGGQYLAVQLTAKNGPEIIIEVNRLSSEPKESDLLPYHGS